MIGLVVNGMRILDLAAEGDSRITIEGDVDLDTKPLKLFHRLVDEELFMLGLVYQQWQHLCKFLYRFTLVYEGY